MAFFADYHVHSEISPDSDTSMANAITSAQNSGITEICFTDHYDPGSPYPGGFDAPDLDLYFENLEKMRRLYPSMQVRSGIELGMTQEEQETAKAYLDGRRFDFVLLSKHFVDGRDPWFEDFFDGSTQREKERRYLEQILSDITTWEDFDVCAHIGYVDKYLDRARALEKPDAPFDFQDFPELIDEILRTLIAKGKGIEINTSTYSVHGYPLPRARILRRYAALGGEIVTLGSDAHTPDRIGDRFADATQLAKECGLKYLCTWSERTPVFHPIDRF